MNGFLGTFLSNGVPSVVNGKNPFYPQRQQFLRITNIPNPAATYVFMDEHPDTLSDGYFWINHEGWADLPGSHHNRAATLSFADAHGERHQWRSAQTVVPVKYKGDQGWHPTDHQAQSELRWLLDHASREEP